MKLKTGEKLVMIGDSITDCGRSRPVGEGSGALGNGYVSLVDSLLGVVYPELKVKVLNVGTSGNTVRDLKGRWTPDVLDLKPDWVSIMIGINDVWRQFDSPLQKERHVELAEYKETITSLVELTQPHVTGIVLMTPFYIEPNASDPMRAMMDSYSEAVRELALKRNTLFVDTQAAFNYLMEYSYPAAIAWDRVHPNQIGHLAIARAFVDAIGFEW